MITTQDAKKRRALGAHRLLQLGLNLFANPSNHNIESSGQPSRWTLLCTVDGLSGNRPADLHGVPQSMLKDCLSGRVKHGTNPGPKPYLTIEEEAELTSHLL